MYESLEDRARIHREAEREPKERRLRAATRHLCGRRAPIPRGVPAVCEGPASCFLITAARRRALSLSLYSIARAPPRMRGAQLLTVMRMRPTGAPSAVMSKKTSGLAIFDECGEGDR